MKTLITCDGVFDILTRAPFPTGADQDSQVERHLSACHECRQLAEALRPAVGLFHEALDEAEDSLPSYAGNMAAQLESSPAMAERFSQDGLRRLPLGFAAVCAACLAAFLLGRSDVGRASPDLPGATWLAMLDDLGLPSACRPEPRGELAVPQSRACCTRCHRADSQVPASPRAVARTAAACLICHDQQARQRTHSSLNTLREFLLARNGPRWRQQGPSARPFRLPGPAKVSGELETRFLSPPTHLAAARTAYGCARDRAAAWLGRSIPTQFARVQLRTVLSPYFSSPARQRQLAFVALRPQCCRQYS